LLECDQNPTVRANEKGEFPFDIEDDPPTRFGTIDQAGKRETFETGLDAEEKPRLFPSSPSQREE
jgi:hypothetical protein